MKEFSAIAGGPREFIAFRIGVQEFCIDIMSVREIRGWTPATALPHAPAYVRGVINLRGSVLPIVDLAERLGFPQTDASARQVIIVVQVGAQIIGLLVDAVSDILTLTTENIQPTPDVASDFVKSFVRGILAIDGRMIGVIELDGVMATDGGGGVKQALSLGVSDSQRSTEFEMSDRDFGDIAAMLYADAGIYMPVSKTTLVYSRLVKRLRALHLENFRQYCDLVGSPDGSGERREMLSALTTNVTRFFREPHHFEHLSAHVLPPLLELARHGGRVRLWSAACSTGPEPYSMALTVLGLEPNAASLDIRILASDIDPRVVEEGRRGVYPAAALAEAPAALRKRYFSGDERRGLQATEELRRLVVFRTLNLNANWPMPGKFHVIFCRNVVIYFDEQTQQAVWSKFAGKLEPGGVLYIGHSERVTGPAVGRFVSDGVTAYRLKEGYGA